MILKGFVTTNMYLPDLPTKLSASDPVKCTYNIETSRNILQQEICQKQVWSAFSLTFANIDLVENYESD